MPGVSWRGRCWQRVCSWLLTKGPDRRGVKGTARRLTAGGRAMGSSPLTWSASGGRVDSVDARPRAHTCEIERLARTLPWSGERLAEAVPAGDLGERLPPLPALPQLPRWIAERDHGHDVVHLGDREDLSDLVHTREARPVRSHAFGPCREDHRLDRPARIGEPEPAPPLHPHRDGQRGLRR